jgi:hypothetical protein
MRRTVEDRARAYDLGVDLGDRRPAKWLLERRTMAAAV